ncbi:NAD-dependent epimerase/dehydratase family protein [Neobacillus sp. LXY-4]|uniref:NAD-dependent epimerase/dehydratase family protein n=1 Tax=Neobacillus sp. LXY-4 TaxID=3379826 RepID=UPI003EE04BB2
MKIILTGGAGFIGSHLAKKLLLEQHDVLILDCLHNYYSIDRKKQQLERLNKEGRFTFKKVNLLEKDVTMAIFKDYSPDVVIHLAALPGVAYSIEQPLEYVDYDIKATINVLEAAGVSGASQVIFASSSSVYGNRQGEPSHEDMANGKVISPYAASKYSAEAFCHVYEHLYGYKVKVLRFFTVYGPWGRPDMAITHFIEKLLRSEEITVFGKGGARDYTYVEDIVNGIYLAMTKRQESDVYNLGSGRPITMVQLLTELNQFFPNMKVNWGPDRRGDVQETWANIQKANQLLGYAPVIDFRTGLLRTIQWAKQDGPI